MIQLSRNHMSSPSKSPRRIVLNVGGARHETYLATLQRNPDSRLGRLAEYHEELTEESRDEYFFDRHPGVFSAVMDYYRSGELHYPMDICGSVVRKELRYWDIDEGNFGSCCVTEFSHYTDNNKILDELRKSLEQKPNPFGILPPTTGLAGARYRMWQTLNKPRCSLTAMVYAAISFTVVAFSIMGYCMETMAPYMRHVNITCHTKTDISKIVIFRMEWLQWLDICCTVFFIAELFAKFACSPRKLRWLRKPMNILDELALVPSLLQIVFHWYPDQCILWYKNIIDGFMILRILRIFRVFHFLRHYGPFRVLLYSVKSAMNAMVMLIVFLGVSVLFFGSLIYHAERMSPDAGSKSNEYRHEFTDLTTGFWWAIITLTTVGYGDKAPETAFGYTIGAIVAVSGLVILSFVVPIISNEFTLLYNFDQAMKNVHANCKVRRRRKTLSVNNSVAFRTLKRQSMKRLGRKTKPKHSDRSDSVDVESTSEFTEAELRQHDENENEEHDDADEETVFTTDRRRVGLKESDL